MSADLKYNIATGDLTGWVAGRRISAKAGSGGRYGSKTPGAVNWWLANNPFAVTVKKTAQNPGGPLPMGWYELVRHESRPNWIRLQPLNTRQMYWRAGFAIHGRGDRGSDGCIVPDDFCVVQQLCLALDELKRQGKPAPVLEVYAAGEEVEQKLQKLKQMMNTA